MLIGMKRADRGEGNRDRPEVLVQTLQLEQADSPMLSESLLITFHTCDLSPNIKTRKLLIIGLLYWSLAAQLSVQPKTQCVSCYS